jgi:hypothetical protein
MPRIFAFAAETAGNLGAAIVCDHVFSVCDPYLFAAGAA